MIFNVLFTRKCNLSCHYCNIVKDYENSPYKSVNKYEELPATVWMDFFNRMYDYFDGDVFFVLYGGEPTLYKDFDKLMSLLVEDEKLKYQYTIISNMTPFARVKISKYVDKLIGLTASVDPISVDHDRSLKSKEGYNYLIEQKKKHPEMDVVAEIVVDKTNYSQLPELVRDLSQNGIWSSISTIENAKNKYYDFAITDKEFLIDKDDQKKIREIIISLFKENYLVHAPEAILHTLSNPPMTTDCDVTDTLSIEPDGGLRLCLRIKGVESAKFTINDLPEKFEQFWKMCKIDKSNYCEGCTWTCPHMINVVHMDNKCIPPFAM